MRHAGLLIFWMMATYTKSYKLGECQHVRLAQLSAQNSVNIRLSHEARRATDSANRSRAHIRRDPTLGQASD